MHIEGSIEASPWLGGQVLAPILNRGAKEVILFVDTFPKIRVFRFDYKRKSFKFEGFMPKRMVSRAQRCLFDQESRTFNYGREGVVLRLLGSTETGELNFWRYGYRRALRQGAMSPQMRDGGVGVGIDQFRVERLPEKVRLIYQRMEPLEVLEHLISHQNLLVCSVYNPQRVEICSITKIVKTTKNYEKNDKNRCKTNTEDPNNHQADKKSPKHNCFKRLLTITDHSAKHPFLERQLARDIKNSPKHLKGRIVLSHPSTYNPGDLERTVKAKNGSFGQIQTICHINQKCLMLVITFINMRARKTIRRLAVSAYEIITQLKSLKQGDFRLTLNHFFYIKEQDCLILSCVYSKVAMNLLIKDASHPEKRRFLELGRYLAKQQKVGFSSLGKNMYSIYVYGGQEGPLRKNNGLIIYFLGPGKSFECFDLTGLEIEFESCEVLQRDGDVCLVASSTHFLCLDLTSGRVLSFMRFGGTLYQKGNSERLVASIDRNKDLLCFRDMSLGGSVHKTALKMVLVDPLQGVKILGQIDLRKILKHPQGGNSPYIGARTLKSSLRKVCITDLLGITSLPKTQKLLILVEITHLKAVWVDEMQQELDMRVKSLIELEIDAQNLNYKDIAAGAKAALFETFSYQGQEKGHNDGGKQEEEYIEIPLPNQKGGEVYRAKFVQNHWVVAQHLADADRDTYFALGVYDSSTKTQIKRVVFPLSFRLVSFGFYAKKVKKIEKNEKIKNWTKNQKKAKKFTKNLKLQQENHKLDGKEVQEGLKFEVYLATKPPSNLNGLYDRKTLIDKFEARNLLDRHNEADLRLERSMQVSMMYKYQAPSFNPNGPEFALKTIRGVRPGQDHLVDNETRSELVFYNRKLEKIHEIADFPLFGSELSGAKFSWVGVGRCYIRLQDGRGVAHRLINLKTNNFMDCFFPKKFEGKMEENMTRSASTAPRTKKQPLICS